MCMKHIKGKNMGTIENLLSTQIQELGRSSYLNNSKYRDVR